jgi:hypothetical protein
MNHEEVAALLGAFALDAVDADEADAIRRHLDECPRCASEVAEHWEVTGLIANAGVDAPPELWDRIAARLEAPPAGARRPAPLQLSSTSTPPSGATLRAYQRVALSVVGTIAAAAAVVAVVLAVQVGRLDQRVGQLAVVSRQTGLTQAVQAALLQPNVRKVTLAATGTSPTGSSAGKVSPGTGEQAAVVVIDPDGSAFVLNTSLPRLAADRTYQLWGVMGGQTVSLGLLGSHPRDVAFTVNPSAPVKVFAVTTEVAGGVVRSTHSPVAEGPTTT